ncbi:MAG: EAL domain-containing protein [Ideonella sp.]|nr:EAL domain-containing protein [Ideonella sp.]MCC7457806.1 EAL domain-containing protein [Nitrospira sp.]
MLHSLAEPAWIVDARSLALVDLNDAARKLLGRGGTGARIGVATDLIDTPEDQAFWADVRSGGAPRLDSETTLVGADGRLLQVVRRIAPLQRPAARPPHPLPARDLPSHHAPSHYLVQLHDRSEQLRQQQERETLLTELQATLESTADGILVTDLAGRIRAFNRRFAVIWGMPESLLERHEDDAVFDWMRRSVGDPHAYQRQLVALQESTLARATETLQLLSGQTLEMVTQPQVCRGRPIGRVWAFRDRTEIVAADRRIETLITTDALTGLPNRRHLGDALELALAHARRDHGGFAVLLLDLDRFKQINDSLGSDAGDRVLLEVTARAKTCLRQGDLLARLGGDQFALVVHRADQRGAEAAAARLLDAIGRGYAFEGNQFTLTCSIGIALYPGDGHDGGELMRHAETAMQRAKQGGRAAFRFHQPNQDADLRARMRLDHAMRQALVARRFRLVYQPQIEIGSGAIVGAEALMRWRDPELGEVPPTQFIAVAEESGFIIALGDWVLGHAVRQAAQWRSKGMPLKVAVNVSALQFQQADFVDRVAAVLREADLPGALLELELTESILVRGAGEALQRLYALSSLGVKLAIDDFGTGYSSLAYLKRFPIGKLKIDRSFIRGVPADDSDAGIVRAVIQMARALNLRVNAEGVESEAQRHFLAQEGCDELQGFLFAPALDPLSFEQRLASQAAPGRHLRVVSR